MPIKQLDPSTAKWIGERFPDGTIITGGELVVRQPDGTRAKVVFEVGEDGVVTYTPIVEKSGGA